MAYIAYYLKPEVIARLSNAAFITPNSKAAIAKLDPEVKKWTPDLTSPNNVVIDGEYWTNNLEPIARRFKEWVLS